LVDLVMLSGPEAALPFLRRVCKETLRSRAEHTLTPAVTANPAWVKSMHLAPLLKSETD
jgi:hypothetical protein